jgi:hypothetical protein
MNKKGLIFILLFVVSTVGAMATTQAATDDKVEVRLNYIPSAYVETGEVYVEFDSRFLDDNMVFGEDDTINFAFFYDVAVLSWGGATTTGDGFQADEWYYDTQDLNSSCQYTVTRFGGQFNVMIDNYDIGQTNFDIWADDGNYQDIAIQLDKGWHYITIVAAELVSDCNHTTWWWEYAKDQKRFYVSEDKEDTPTLLEDAMYNDVDVAATGVNSENLNLAYNITDFSSNPRPRAEATLNQYTVEDLGNITTGMITTDIAVQYNASDTADIVLTDGPYGAAYVDVYGMGPHAYLWILNDGPMLIPNATWEPTTITGEGADGDQLTQYARKGQNFIYFVLIGFQVDSYSQLFGNPAPQLAISTVRYDLYLGEIIEEVDPDPCEGYPDDCCPTPTPGFGIFISVSILGLAAVIALLRKRK